MLTNEHAAAYREPTEFTNIAEWVLECKSLLDLVGQIRTVFGPWQLPMGIWSQASLLAAELVILRLCDEWGVNLHILLCANLWVTLWVNLAWILGEIFPPFWPQTCVRFFSHSLRPKIHPPLFFFSESRCFWPRFVSFYAWLSRMCVVGNMLC